MSTATTTSRHSANTAVAAPQPVLAHRHGQAATPPLTQPARGSLRYADLAETPEQAGFLPPTGREEQWRFTPIQHLASVWAGPPDSALTYAVTPAPGVSTELLERHDPRVGQLAGPPDYAAALAWSATQKAQLVSISAAADRDQPILVDLPATPATPACGHLVLDVAPQAKATVVLRGSGQGVVLDNVEIRMGDHAELTLLTVLEWQPGATYLGAHNMQLGRDSKLRASVVNLGGGLVRLSSTVGYTQPGGQVTLLGLALADSSEHVENRLFVDHSVPHCRSRVEYKGVLQGAGAHTVWVGDVLIRAQAEGTDTYELNRNLVLTDSARADSVPNLEIETGEILGAGHASATGRFDDEQVFYLTSRGISEELARRLVVQGFVGDLIGRIGVPSFTDKLTDAVERRLGGFIAGSADEVKV